MSVCARLVRARELWSRTRSDLSFAVPVCVTGQDPAEVQEKKRGRIKVGWKVGAPLRTISRLGRCCFEKRQRTGEPKQREGARRRWGQKRMQEGERAGRKGGAYIPSNCRRTILCVCRWCLHRIVCSRFETLAVISNSFYTENVIIHYTPEKETVMQRARRSGLFLCNFPWPHYICLSIIHCEFLEEIHQKPGRDFRESTHPSTTTFLSRGRDYVTLRGCRARHDHVVVACSLMLSLTASFTPAMRSGLPIIASSPASIQLPALTTNPGSALQRLETAVRHRRRQNMFLLILDEPLFSEPDRRDTGKTFFKFEGVY